MSLGRAKRARAVGAALVALCLGACVEVPGPDTVAAPASVAPTPPGRGMPSDARLELARYYNAVQQDQLTRGLMRVDGGGPDTPYTSETLFRNFERIVFFQEFRRSGGSIQAGDNRAGRMSRWAGPVRISAEFGPTVPETIKSKDSERIASFATRLGRVSGHSIAPARRGTGNFVVLVAGQDDARFVAKRLRETIPRISAADIQFFTMLPRSFYCIVFAVSNGRAPHEYSRAVALIRAEQPDLMRQACIHEELAQGLGLPNDSPEARPSIFNDDDEFALLTSHDELLLKMLYDPRLSPGMSLEEARPIVRLLSQEVTGQAL